MGEQLKVSWKSGAISLYRASVLQARFLPAVCVAKVQEN